MQSYPEPNDLIGQYDGLNIQGYRFIAPTPLRYNTYITRLDYSVDPNGKHTVFFRGNLQNDNEVRADDMAQFPGQQPNRVTLTNNKGLATGLTSLLKPNLISNFRYGLTRVGYGAYRDFEHLPGQPARFKRQRGAHARFRRNHPYTHNQRGLELDQRFAQHPVRRHDPLHSQPAHRPAERVFDRQRERFLAGGQRQRPEHSLGPTSPARESCRSGTPWAT